MGHANRLRWGCVLLLVVISGCASKSFKEDVQAVSPDLSTVFGRVSLVKEGGQQKIDLLGGSTLMLVVRGENDYQATQYLIRDPGYFFWDLPPGKYMILGYVKLLQRGPIRMEFVVPPEAKALYVGDLTITMLGDHYLVDHKDNFAAGLAEFRKKFPDSLLIPEHTSAEMEKKPGTYSMVTWVCGPEWGIECKGWSKGVMPIYPGERGGAVDSLTPTLTWTPSPQPDVTYDVVVYEEQKFPRNQVGAVMDSLPGRLIYYAQDVPDAMVRLDPPLQPGASYLWSVRFRRGEIVSTWSTFGHFDFFLVGWQSERGEWFSLSTPNK